MRKLLITAATTMGMCCSLGAATVQTLCINESGQPMAGEACQYYEVRIQPGSAATSGFAIPQNVRVMNGSNQVLCARGGAAGTVTIIVNKSGTLENPDEAFRSCRWN